LRMTGEANGVDDLEWLDRNTLHALEPEVEGVAALLSPSTGIVDSHALMLALQGDLEQAGGQVALRSRLVGGAFEGGGLRLTIDSDGETIELRTRARSEERRVGKGGRSRGAAHQQEEKQGEVTRGGDT